MTPTEEKLIEFENKVMNQDALLHRDALLAIAAILKTPEGVKLFDYLFHSLEVATLPDIGLEGSVLNENLGFLRAGNSIYKLACEADAEIAARILTKIERRRYDRLYERNRIENGLYDGNA